MHINTAMSQADNSQLVLIDLQTRLLSAMPDTEKDRVLSNAGKLAQAAKILDIPTLVSEQYPQGLGHTEIKLSELIAPTSHHVEKSSFSCCQAPDFMKQLQATPRPQIIIAGVEAHVCVLQTSLELAQSGYQVFVVEDAVCSRKTEHAQNAIERLRQASIIVTNTESVMFEWLTDANHPAFKALSALIR